jgi:multidrug efflux pump subunit AcrB
MNITEVCIRKPVFAWMLMAATIVFGGVAARASASASSPTSTSRRSPSPSRGKGAAPEVIEHDVVEPLEEALMQVEGVESITSTSRQGSANVTSSSTSSANVDLALQDVQAKVSQAQRRCRATSTRRSSPSRTPKTSRSCGSASRGPSPAGALRLRALPREGALQTVPGVGEVMMGGATSTATSASGSTRTSSTRRA